MCVRVPVRACVSTHVFVCLCAHMSAGVCTRVCMHACLSARAHCSCGVQDSSNSGRLSPVPFLRLSDCHTEASSKYLLNNKTQRKTNKDNGRAHRGEPKTARGRRAPASCLQAHTLSATRCLCVTSSAAWSERGAGEVWGPGASRSEGGGVISPEAPVPEEVLKRSHPAAQRLLPGCVITKERDGSRRAMPGPRTRAPRVLGAVREPLGGS